MQTYYSGAHGMIFRDISGAFSFHSWNDLYLVPRGKPVVEQPPVKTNTIEIPGANGDIDMTDIPLGFPTYGKRTGTWEFVLAHDQSGWSWEEGYSRILERLHGKRMHVILDDDRSYFYTGRLSVNGFKSEDMCDVVTIGYNLNPFKQMIWTTTEDWAWNPFDFWYGIEVQEYFKNVELAYGSPTAIEYEQSMVGCAPVMPIFTVTTPGYDASDPATGGVKMRIHNTGTGVDAKTFNLPEGVSSNPLIEFVVPKINDKVRMIFSETKAEGTTISIDFRPGRL